MYALALRPAPAGVRRARHRFWLFVDSAVAGCFAIPTAGVLANEMRGRWSFLLVPVLVGLVVGPMALRRRWPARCLAVAVGAGLLLILVEPRAAVVALCAVGYTLYQTATTLRLPSALAGLAAAVVAAVATALPDFRHPFAAGLFATLYAVVWVVGFGLAMERRHTAALLARQVELSAAEVEHALAVVSQQRLGIARDLHDVVAHGITTITVQAAYARLLLPEESLRAADAVAAIETVGRQTLTELRQMLHVLRAPTDDGENRATHDPAQTTPTPGLADLGALTARAKAAGLQVDLDITRSAGTIPAGIEAAAYRTVQEALTNAVKHAAAQRVSVAVRHQPDRLVVEVTDDGRGCPDTTAFGYGLVGMRERALLYGGSLQVGRGPHGGFAVVSTFPLIEQTFPAPTDASTAPAAS